MIIHITCCNKHYYVMHFLQSHTDSYWFLPTRNNAYSYNIHSIVRMIQLSVADFDEYANRSINKHSCNIRVYINCLSMSLAVYHT